jgi:crotonobetainyl-CoA:carnitine CoA-transferase CaiB-like acyl-CoA transferase
MDGPLVGLTVIDMSQMLAAPFCAMLLADYGADVIKVEPPRTGDSARRAGWDIDGTSAWWRLYGRNKKSVTLDLKQAAARDVMLRLIDSADVLIENMRPGKLEALGLGPDVLHARNPGLVIVRVTGWGQTGPYKDRAAFGTQAEAMTGFAFGNGHPDGPPTLPSYPLADAVTGYLGAYAVMAALWGRERDAQKRGQVIDLSLFESLFALLGPQASAFDRLGIVNRREGNRSPVSVPRGIYRTRDERWVAISCATEPVVRRAFGAMGKPELYDDPRYSSRAARRERIDEVDAIMQDWIGQHDLDDVMARFTAAEATVAPVNTIKDVLEDPHFQARDLLVDAPSDDTGPLKMQNVFPRLSRTPGRVRWSGRALGADTVAVLAERLGLDDAAIEQLRQSGAI